MDPASVRFYVAELVVALCEMNMAGITHRDLKPENVMIDNEGHVCLNDFGLAVCDTRELEGYCGTEIYVAPELHQDNETYGFQCDWWSLGVMMWEMLTGTVSTLNESDRSWLNALAGTFP